MGRDELNKRVQAPRSSLPGYLVLGVVLMLAIVFALLAGDQPVPLERMR